MSDIFLDIGPMLSYISNIDRDTKDFESSQFELAKSWEP
jgi:hypothetical protein